MVMAILEQLAEELAESNPLDLENDHDCSNTTE